MKIRIEHSDGNAREFGYGLYINAVTDFPHGYPNSIMASECLPRDSTAADIRRAEKRVRARGLRKFNALLPN